MPNIFNAAKTINSSLPAMGGGDGCTPTIHNKIFNKFQKTFGEQMAGTTPTVESSYDDNEGCTIVETFPNDTWSSSDWYCTDDRRIKTFTYKFELFGEKYSVQAWRHSKSGTWINLYKDDSLTASVTPDYRHCSTFFARGQERSDMVAIDQGIKWASGIDIDICMDESFLFYCDDEI